jgi:hypothetical protein
LDPAAGYRAALAEHLPNATRVVDHFHAVKLANSAIEQDLNRWLPLVTWFLAIPHYIVLLFLGFATGLITRCSVVVCKQPMMS